MTLKQNNLLSHLAGEWGPSDCESTLLVSLLCGLCNVPCMSMQQEDFHNNLEGKIKDKEAPLETS